MRVIVVKSHITGIGTHADKGDVLDLPDWTAHERIKLELVRPAPPEPAAEESAATGGDPAPAIDSPAAEVPPVPESTATPAPSTEEAGSDDTDAGDGGGKKKNRPR